MPKLSRVQWLAHTLSLLPVIVLIWDALTGNLTANPIQAATQRTGSTALMILMASLAITPARKWLSYSPIGKIRRTLGLYSFFYATVHVFIFVFLDYGGSLQLIWSDINNKRFILAGAVAFLILLALALTSTRAAKTRMGKNWKRLHRLVYLAGFMVIVHTLWAAKVDYRLPIVYLVVLTLLLVMRLPGIQKMLPFTHNNPPNQKPPPDNHI